MSRSSLRMVAEVGGGPLRGLNRQSKVMITWEVYITCMKILTDAWDGEVTALCHSSDDTKSKSVSASLLLIKVVPHASVLLAEITIPSRHGFIFPCPNQLLMPHHSPSSGKV